MEDKWPLRNSFSEAEQKQAMLAAIVASTDDAIVSKTLEGIITSWNPAAERMFGFAEKEILGEHISTIIPKDLLDEETYIINEIKHGRKVEHFETVRITKDCKPIRISVTISPITGISGQIIGASKIARDISEQKKAAEKQSILASIIDNSDDTILSKTLEGIITSWNRAAERMFGYTEQEALGRHISMIIPPERLEEEAFIIREVSKGNKVNHFQTIRKAKNGKEIHISLSVSPITDNTGKIVGASKIARDITDLKTSQEELARLNKQLKELNDKKDEFIGLASHELKTPLTSIGGYLQILEQLVDSPQHQVFIEKAIKQVRKVNTLVADLLDVTKIKAGKLPYNFEPFDLVQMVKEVAGLIAHTNSSYQIPLQANQPKIIIAGDALRMEQVIINLLTNAIRYSPGKEVVQIVITASGKEVLIAVRDFGIGIAQDKLNIIFNRFYRVDNSNRVPSGLGIGLYLAMEIVEGHNGKIWVESEPGKGSVFYVSLPYGMAEHA